MADNTGNIQLTASNNSQLVSQGASLTLCMVLGPWIISITWWDCMFSKWHWLPTKGGLKILIEWTLFFFFILTDVSFLGLNWLIRSFLDWFCLGCETQYYVRGSVCVCGKLLRPGVGPCYCLLFLFAKAWLFKGSCLFIASSLTQQWVNIHPFHSNAFWRWSKFVFINDDSFSGV